MSDVRKTIGLDRAGIRQINDFGKLRIWLDRLVVTLEENYKLQRNVTQGSTAAETPNWFIREANAADVTANEALAVGNLIVEHKTNGTKREFEQ
ncbi:hypothetical protein KAR91_66650 [Candidatus Pacearchaeota archaeon]|nr:hypothetical protein [Candidatus Pacearchaeota archaeon]